jgi:hypothetical protein
MGPRIADPAELLPPAADALDGESACIGVDADIDPAMIGGDIINPIGRYLAQFRDLEVMDPHWLGLTLGTQFTTAVLEIANQFLLLRIDRYRRFAGCKRGSHRRIEVSELRIAVRVMAALDEPNELPRPDVVDCRRSCAMF